MTSARRSARSTTRLEYPHSLSYQEITLTRFPPSTWSTPASKIEECGFPMMSVETIGSFDVFQDPGHRAPRPRP